MAHEFKDAHLFEIGVVVMSSATIGIVRFLFLLRRGRQFKYLDLVLEPALAVFGGLLMWALSEYSDTPEIMQAVMTSLGAWGGPRTIHYLEKKYMGGSRETDAMPLDEAKK